MSKLQCVLVHETDNRPAVEGETLKTFRGETVTLTGWKFPYDPQDNLYRGGKIYCQTPGAKYQDQWYPSVCGLKFILTPEIA